MSLSNLVSLFSRKKTPGKAARGRKRSQPARRKPLSLEALEERLALVVAGSLVGQGIGLDGVVSLFMSNPGSTSGGGCTGTLLTSGRHILTAAHCLTDGNGTVKWTSTAVSFELPGRTIAGGMPITLTVPASQFSIHPDWRGNNASADIAILELPELAPSGPMGTGADRYPLYRAADEVRQIVRVVGYGLSGAGNTGGMVSDGLKRTGFNFIDTLGQFVLGPANTLAIDFDNDRPENDAFGQLFSIPDTGTFGEALGFLGDSGGPLLMPGGQVAGVYALVQSYGGDEDVLAGTNGSFGEAGFYTRVSSFATWIDNTVGRSYELVVDMNNQLVGTIPGADSIELRRTENFLEVFVNGQSYHRDFLSNISSITIRGSRVGDNLSVAGNLGKQVTFDGGGVLSINGDTRPSNLADYIIVGKGAEGELIVSVNNEILSLILNGINRIEVHGGHESDQIFVNYSPVGIPLRVYGEGGDDHIQLGGLNHALEQLHSRVLVDGGEGTDEVTLDDRSNMDNAPAFYTSHPIFTIDDTSVNLQSNIEDYTSGTLRTFTALTDVDYQLVETMTIQGGSFGNVFNVERTAEGTSLMIEAGGYNQPFFILTGHTRSTVNIGRNGLLQRIRGPVHVSNPYFVTTLNVNDTNDAGYHTVTLDRIPSTGAYGVLFSEFAPITYQPGQVNELNLDPGWGGFFLDMQSTPAGLATTIDTHGGINQINVQSTGANSATTINATFGSNSVFVTSAGHNLDLLGGTLAVNGNGATYLHIDDRYAIALGSAYSFTNEQLHLARYRGGHPTFTQITYKNLVNLTLLDTIASQNLLTVLSTGGTNQMVLDTIGSTTQVNVGDVNTNLDGIGNLVVEGDATGTTLILDDRANTPRVSPFAFYVPLAASYEISDENVARTSRTRVFKRQSPFDVVDEPHQASITYHNVASLSLYGGSSGEEAINVLGTSANIPVTVYAGPGLTFPGLPGTNIVNVGSNGLTPSSSSLDLIGGLLSVIGQGSTVLNFNDQGRTAAQGYAFLPDGNDAGNLYRGLGRPIYFSNVAAVTLHGGSGGNAINVFGTPANIPITIYTGAGLTGSNTVNVGSSVLITPPSHLDLLGGLLSVIGKGSTALNFNDQGTTAIRSYAFYAEGTDAGYFVRNGTSSQVYFRNVAGVTLHGGSGGNDINVFGTPANIPITVYAGAVLNGSNTVNVGSSVITPSSSILDLVAGFLSVIGQGSTALSLNDQGTAANQTYVVTAGEFTRASGQPAVITERIAYSGLASLAVHGGSGNDTFQVQSTAVGTTTLIDTGRGNDVIEVGNNRMLSGINGPVHLQSATSFSGVDLFLDDSNELSPKTQVVLDDGSVTGLAPATISWTPSAAGDGGITGVRILGGRGGNTFTVQNTSPLYHGTFLSAGAGANQVNVRGTTGSLIIQSVLGGHNDVIIGGQAPVLGGTMANLFGPVYFTYDQTYTNLTLDDSGASTDYGKNVVFGYAGGQESITGLSPAPIYFISGSPTTTGVRTLNVYGGGGDDTFTVTRPLPVLAIDGGPGTNTLDYSTFTSSVIVDLLTGAATGLAGTRRIQNATGGAGSDILIGNELVNVLRGNGGNNMLLGLGGNDRLYGGAGRDILFGGMGADFLDGGSGDDILNGGYTDYDTQISNGVAQHNIDLAALDAVMAKWASSDSYNVRFGAIKSGVGSTSQYRLDPTTVHDDAAADALTGGDGQDWFFAPKNGDSLTDLDFNPSDLNNNKEKTTNIR